jgi:uncharacterized membrane protein YfcA
MDFVTLIILIVAGFLSGIVNTLAGSGSVFTLSSLIFLGIPVHIANGTNRLGAVTSSITSILTFRKHPKVKPLVQTSKWYTIPTVLGSVFGAVLSNIVEAKTFEYIILALMFVMLFLVVSKPKRWLQETQESVNRNTIGHFLLLFAIGTYAGFIQMGMGILYLSSFVLYFGFSVVESNILKIVLTLFMVIPATLVFLWNDQILWLEGLLLAFGQGVGAYLATKFLLENKKAAQIVRYLLILMILMAIGKLGYSAVC